MTDAALRRRIAHLATEWIPILGLSSWDIQLRCAERKYLATAHVKLRYEEATLYFNLARMHRELPPSRRAHEELVLHELVHCHEAPHDTETRVSRVTRSLLRTKYGSTWQPLWHPRLRAAGRRV